PRCPPSGRDGGPGTGSDRRFGKSPSVMNHITTHHMTQVLNRATSALCTSNTRRFDLRSQPTLPRDMTARGTDLSIAIVGAGLAGLCLAQSLRREGLDIHIFERDPSPHVRRQGYRITLDEHGASALKKCLPPESFEAVL